LSSKKQPCHICVVNLEVCKDKNSTKRQAQKQAGKETKEGIFLLSFFVILCHVCCFSRFLLLLLFVAFAFAFAIFAALPFFLLVAATTPPRGCHGPLLIAFRRVWSCQDKLK